MSIKQEELVPLADMVWESFKSDQPELEQENSTLTAAYLDGFKEMTEEVRDLEQADKLLVKQKGVTRDLYLAANGMRKDLKLFQLVVKKAGLDTKVVTVLLKNINTRNIEGALVNIKSIQQIVGDNNALLSSKGMKASFPAFLEDKFVVLTKLSNQQNKILEDRKTLTENNHGSYTALNNYISEVCHVGKTVYEGKVKADEYNIKKLLSKLHSSGGGGGDKPAPPTN